MGIAVTVTPLGEGMYRVTEGSRTWTVAVAGPPENRWVWIDGQVAKIDLPARTRGRGRTARHDLSSPMPATVVRVLVDVGATVARGDTLVMLEAMKMELPIRAPVDGHVRAVHCTAGDLVQPGVNLLDLDPQNSQKPQNSVDPRNPQEPQNSLDPQNAQPQNSLDPQGSRKPQNS